MPATAKDPSRSRQTQDASSANGTGKSVSLAEARSYRLPNPLEAAVGLSKMLHDRTRDFNAGVRNQVIEMLAMELTEADHVVDDLLLTLDPDFGDVANGVEHIELRGVVDEVAQSLATTRHMRVSVRGNAAVRADVEVARHIIRNLLRGVAYVSGQNITVYIGSGFSKVFVEVSYDGAAIEIGDEEPRFESVDGDAGTSPLPIGLAMSVARSLARALGGDVAEAETKGDQRAIELSLPKILGNQWSKVTIADSIFDPAPDLPTRSQISEILDTGGPEMVYQPIVDIRAHQSGSPTIVGHEALARFPLGSPPEWLEAAGHAGTRLELELSAISSAVSAFGPTHPGFLTLNLSDQTLLSPDLLAAIEGIDAGLVVLELSEAALIKSYELTKQAMDALRDRGVRLAIDNVGAAEIDLWSILRLKPEVLKVDMSLVRGVDAEATNRALIRGLAAMAADLGIITVAEGIERVEERDVLVDVGIEFGQGYLLGRPRHL